MPVLSLSIGSNIDPAANVRAAVAELRWTFPDLRCSTVYESEAVGFAGDNFLNLVATTDTAVPLLEVVVYLKELEDSLGRDRNSPRFAGRTIDLDILTYGDSDGREAGLKLPRPEVTENAYDLEPLAELLPDMVHTPSGRTYGELWSAYDKARQQLWPADFDWQGVLG